MMRALLAYLRVNARVQRCPGTDDRRRGPQAPHRERERLLKERTAHTNRIKGLLHAQGIRDAMPLKAGFIDKLDSLRTGDWRALTGRLKEEIVREHERLCLVSRQLAALEASSRASNALRRRARRRPRSCISLSSKASAWSAGKGWSMKCSIATSTTAARSAVISG